MTKEPLDLTAVNRTPSLYQIVAERLSAAIRDAGLRPGSRIPSERELGEQFGVSRTVIREAIRHLAAKGVLEARTGSGVWVADIGHQGISESISLFLGQRGPLDPEKINEVRQTLELSTTNLAATRATEEQLHRIRTECERISGLDGKAEPASEADLAFHRAIAEATGNELFLVLVDSLADVLLHIRLATLGEPKRVAATLQQHRRIADALEDRDADAAVQAMREHLADSLVAFREAQKKGA